MAELDLDIPPVVPNSANPEVAVNTGFDKIKAALTALNEALGDGEGGAGLPEGGSVGQFLALLAGGVAGWVNPPSGGGGGGGGGMFPIDPPSVEEFPYQASGGVITQRNRANGYAYTHARTDTGGGGDLTSFTGKNVPAGTAWTVDTIIKLPPHINSSNYIRLGLAIYDSGSQRVLIFGQAYNATEITKCILHARIASYIATPYIKAIRTPMPEMWLRIVYNGTDYKFYESLDFGETYDLRFTAAKADYFTADKIGLATESYATNDPQGSYVNCLYWKEA